MLIENIRGILLIYSFMMLLMYEEISQELPIITNLYLNNREHQSKLNIK